MAKAFASQSDMSEKKISFTEIGEGLYALPLRATQTLV